jgi:5-formyltetrahydrofolate cyclo-ligase
MTKKELREKYKSLRADLSNREQDLISNQIKENLLANFDLKGKKISCFVPITRFNEINTWLILDSVDASFYLPVISADDQLKHLFYEGKDKLKETAWGILEPQAGEEIDPSELDFVLVPLLTINKEGYRVGYGKGYYDKFLVRCNSKCVFIGLYQFDDAEIIDDLHESDIAVHYCVTPKGLLGADNL